MEFHSKETSFKDLKIFELFKFNDGRGDFCRIFNQKEFAKLLPGFKVAQINYSRTKQAGTIRGMHYQASPGLEAKFISCCRGTVFDVVVDIRKNSETFMKYFSITLSSEVPTAIYVPEGFAHGFQSLEKNSELIYLHSEYYNENLQRGLNPLDPTLSIPWPLALTAISQKDSEQGFVSDKFVGLEI